MADEQPNTPSAEPQTADAPSAAEPSSVEPEAQGSTPSWWTRMFRRRGDPDPEAEGADSKPEAPASNALTLTQEELDRRIQAETDRREAKRMQEARARQKRELRDSDPWQYVEQERREEQEQQGSAHMAQFLSNLGVEHDRVSIDPLFLALPKAEQDRIRSMDGAGTGLAGRRLVVTEALKSLEKHWRAEGAKDAETKLRRNPAFRKQLLSEARGQGSDPDVLPAVSASEADRTVSSLLRRHYNLG